MCFLRLDFETFTILGTGGSANPGEGVCLDTFQVTVGIGCDKDRIATIKYNTYTSPIQIFQSTPAQFVPIICGENRGQHSKKSVSAFVRSTATMIAPPRPTYVVYVDVGANAGDSATLIFEFDGAAVFDRRWDIKVTQVECTNPGS